MQRLEVISKPGVAYWDTPAAALLAWDMRDPASPRLVLDKALPGRETTVRDRNLLALSADGRTVWTSNPLTAHDVATGRTRYQTDIPGYVVDVSPDGRTVAVDAGVDVALLDARTGRRRTTLRGDTAFVNAVRFSGDSGLLASTSFDGTARIWDVATGAATETLELGSNQVPAVAFSADDTVLYTAGAEPAIRVWDLAGGQRFLTEVRAPGEFGVGWSWPSPGGTYTVHNYVDGGVRFFDNRTGQATDFAGPSDGIAAGAFTADSTRFVGALGGRLWVWDPATGRLLAHNRGRAFDYAIWDLALTADGSRIVAADEKGTLHLVDGETLEEVGRAVQVGTWSCCASAGPDNRIGVAVAGRLPHEIQSSGEFAYSSDEWVRVDLESGRVLTRGNTGFALFAAALSPDGRRVAVAGVDGEVGLMDAESGKEIGPSVLGHGDSVAFVFWASDGSKFVTTSRDGTVAIWDGSTGEPLGTAVLPERLISAAQFAPDGTTVVISTYRDALYEWDTRTTRAVEFACTLVGRDFTEAEWRRWFGERPYRPTCPGT